MIQLLKKHTLISLYTFVFAILLIGLFATSKWNYFGLVFTFFGSLIAAYALLNQFKVLTFFTQLFSKINNQFTPAFLTKFAYFLVFYTIGFILIHLIILQGSPAIKALMLDNVNDIANLRLSITEGSSRIISYNSSFIIKGMLPFLLLFLFITKKNKLYTLLLVIGSFYAFSLMQKSYIITLLLPSLIYAIYQKKYGFSLTQVVVMISVIFGLTFIANPEPPVIEGVQVTEKYTKLERIIIGLSRRVFIVPGEVVSQWFETVPAKKPFLNGNGYQFFAKLKGEPFVEYSVELYPILKPEYAVQGLTGTVNTASFMYDYVNFGKLGLLISGILLALFFIVVEAIFANDLMLKLSLNSFPILLLSSTALTTSFFSGGWFLLIGLYFIFKPLLKFSSPT
jgi:hypothetical protein